MKLSNLLPRALDPAGGTEAVTLMNALFVRTHLDRRLARRIGWRGMRPSFARSPAWTARVAERNAVYGIAFREEDAEQGILSGRFAVYVFPDPDETEGATPAMRAVMASPDYRGMIREFSSNLDRLGAFRAAELELLASADGSGLALTLSARTSQRQRLPDGTLEAPFGAFHRAAPLFAALSMSLSAALEEDGELVLALERAPGIRTAAAPVSGILPDPSRAERLVSLTHASGSFSGKLPGKRMKKLFFAHRPSGEETRDLPVIHVLTGFLGAGKTTLLRNWLDDLNNRERYTGVIQNEFGEVDLDSLVLKGETRVEALDDGCVCCSLSDSLRPGIERLMASTPAEQFVLETTGLADPMNVMGSLMTLSDLVERGLLITVVDAYDLTRREGLAAGTAEGAVRLKQIMNADVIVCSKADAVEEEKLESLMAALHGLNGDALVLPAFHGQAPFAVLDKFYWHKLDERRGELASRLAPRNLPGEEKKAGGLFEDGNRSGEERGEAAASGQKWRSLLRESDAGAFDTFSLPFGQAVTAGDVKRLIAEAGPGLSRAKGIVRIEGEGPCVVQYAAGVLSLEEAPDAVCRAWERSAESDEPPGFLVFIGRNLTKPEGIGGTLPA